MAQVADRSGMRPHGSKAELEARRFHALQLLDQGLTLRAVADRVGATPGSVFRWRHAYRGAGPAGVRAKRHPGAKPKLSPAQRVALVQVLLEGPQAHGSANALWTLRRVAELIGQQFGVHYHPAHVWRLLRTRGWSPQKPARWARERDEVAIAYWRTTTWPQLKKRRSGSDPALS